MLARALTIWLMVGLVGATAEAEERVVHPPVVGTYRTCVYAVDFADAHVRCTMDEIEAVVGVVAAYYGTTSFGQMEVAPTVIRDPASPDGHFALDHSCAELAGDSSRFDGEVWDAIKARTGIDLAVESQQATVKIVKEWACSRHGSADQGGALAQVGRCWDGALFAHEYGHTLGLAHASKNRPPGKRSGEYAAHEVMGHPGRRNLEVGLNAPERMQLGWIQEAAVRTVTSDADVVLTSLDATPLDPESAVTTVIRIPRSDDVAMSPFFRDHYYVALRGGTVDVHGVEVSPRDPMENELFFGNTLQRLRKRKPAGRYDDKSGRFSLTWTARESGEADVAVTIH